MSTVPPIITPLRMSRSPIDSPGAGTGPSSPGSRSMRSSRPNVSYQPRHTGASQRSARRSSSARTASSPRTPSTMWNVRQTPTRSPSAMSRPAEAWAVR